MLLFDPGGLRRLRLGIVDVGGGGGGVGVSVPFSVEQETVLLRPEIDKIFSIKIFHYTVSMFYLSLNKSFHI